jgi:hypothetical protein
MVSAHPHPEAYAAFRIPGRTLLGGPMLTRTRVVSIDGKKRVRSVVLENLDTGVRSTIECDTVITTGDWIPDHELARTADLVMDAGTRGPLVDAGLRTSRAGVFAVGNLVHPVDTADGAALDGRHVAGAVTGWLADGNRLTGRPEELQLEVESPLRWVTPHRVPVGGGAPRGRLLLWVDEYRRLPVVVAAQSGMEVGRVRVPWPAAPGRAFRVPERVLGRANPSRGPVTIRLA